jgi:hypothetical protein
MGFRLKCDPDLSLHLPDPATPGRSLAGKPGEGEILGFPACRTYSEGQKWGIHLFEMLSTSNDIGLAHVIRVRVNGDQRVVESLSKCLIRDGSVISASHDRNCYTIRVEARRSPID